MTNTSNVTIKYTVNSLTASGPDRISLGLLPTREDDADTSAPLQNFQNALNLLLTETEAKVFWPGQEVTLTIQ